MIDQLKTASVLLKVANTRGARIEAKWQSNAPHAAKPATPERALEGAVEEIARLAELCGFGDRIETAVKEARARVREHLKEQAP